jgi:seryl-tRNA synthetase
VQIQDRNKEAVQTKLDAALKEMNNLSNQIDLLSNKNTVLTQDKIQMIEIYKSQMDETTKIVENLKLKLEQYKSLYGNIPPADKDKVIEEVGDMVDQIGISNKIVEKAMEL